MTNNKKDSYVSIPPLFIDKSNIDEFCKKAGIEEWVAEKFKKGKLSLKDLEKIKSLRFARVKGDGTFEYSDNEFFTKNDKDKLQPSLIEPEFIEGMAKVLTLGAQKYSKDNWKKCEDKGRYKDALLRHILAYLKGEEKDEETGLSHLYHAACNLMFLEFMK